MSFMQCMQGLLLQARAMHAGANAQLVLTRQVLLAG